MPPDPHASALDVRREPIGDMTPEYVVSVKRHLSVHCAECRLVTEVDALALAMARPHQPLRSMKFVCRTCGQLGRISVSGWMGGRVEWS